MKFTAKALLVSTCMTTCMTLSAVSFGAQTLTIATVNNSDMIRMQKLSKTFEAEHPEIKLNWVVLEENVLRQRLTTDIATQGGQFDVLTIGMYEAALWGAKGWLEPMKDLPASYDLDDVFPSVRDGLSVKGFAVCPPVLRRKLDHLLPHRPVQKRRAEHARAPDLEPDRRIRRQTHRQVQRAIRPVPAWQSRLGREHGADHYPGQRLRSALVR